MEDETPIVHRSPRPRPPHPYPYPYRLYGGSEESDALKRSAERLDSLNTTSGAGSVRRSEELQALSQADNQQEILQGQKRLDYKAQNGETKNLTQQVKMVQGRAIYQSGARWIDSRLDEQQELKVTRIQFMSDDYFELYRSNRAVAEFLALGQNVTFVWQNAIYEIYK